MLSETIKDTENKLKLLHSIYDRAVEAEANGLPCVISNTIPKEAVVNKAVDALGIEDGNIIEWVDSIEAFSKINKSLNREDFMNNHYDIELEASQVEKLMLN